MKIKLGVFFGGKSVEHEVSIITALQAIENMDKDNPDYWGEDKRKLIIALCNTYEKNEKNPVFIRAFGDRWIFCKIRLFRMRRNKNM